MAHETTIVGTGVAAILFAAAFLFGHHVALLRRLLKNPHSLISFGSGMSAAYVFVHLMPELHEARRAFVESVSMTLRYEGMAIYYLSLLGFLVFYGLDRLRQCPHESDSPGQINLAFKLQIGGFSVYVWLMSYLLLHHLGDASISIPLYAAAITFHFLALDRTLHFEHGLAYERFGRFVFAGSAIMGWGTGVLITLPHHILALLVAFISGAIIMNSTVMELASEENAKFIPFLAGGIIYGLILLPLG